MGVDSVIRGFSEGMRQVREGDRIIITMTPELGYGARERPGIPANSTLVFDYEILAVKPLSFAKLMREAIAAGTVDEAIAKAKAMPNLKDYYVSASSIQAAATVANRKEAGTGEKVLALGLTLLPEAYQLHQALGRLQATRGDKPAAIKSYETALKLNPKHRGAHEYIGEAYLMQGNLGKAKEHLGQLDKLCLFGCEEYDDLKKAIAEFETKTKK